MYLATTPAITIAATRETDSATARVTFTPDDPDPSESATGTAALAYAPPFHTVFSWGRAGGAKSASYRVLRVVGEGTPPSMQGHRNFETNEEGMEVLEG